MFPAYFLVIAKNWKKCTISKDGGREGIVTTFISDGNANYYNSYIFWQEQ